MTYQDKYKTIERLIPPLSLIFGVPGWADDTGDTADIIPSSFCIGFLPEPALNPPAECSGGFLVPEGLPEGILSDGSSSTEVGDREIDKM
jgi:hypothetical protein